MSRNLLLAGIGAAAGIAGVIFTRRQSWILEDKVVFITGGSRGLGLVLAREFARRGAKVAISARDAEELSRAESDLKRIHPDIFAIPADITSQPEVESAIHKATQHFGDIDVLVNNAGTMVVGPMENMTTEDYRRSIDTHFWGPYFATMAVLPGMLKRRSGRIVNISSVGGKISVPHLLPYSVGKFALTGFSEGLRSELLPKGLFVTTVCPGLMRTGSPRNASFKGRNQAEYAWFSISDSLPVISINAQRAARKIVDACVRGTAEVILTLPAKLAIALHGISPCTTINLLTLANRLLPGPGGVEESARTGTQSSSKMSSSWITTLDQQAAEENNQIAWP